MFLQRLLLKAAGAWCPTTSQEVPRRAASEEMKGSSHLLRLSGAASRHGRAYNNSSAVSGGLF